MSVKYDDLTPRAFENAVSRFINDEHLSHNDKLAIADYALAELRRRNSSSYVGVTPTTLERAKDVAMKATLCAQIMLQNPVVVANEKARHICVDTRDTANQFLAAHPDASSCEPEQG